MSNTEFFSQRPDCSPKIYAYELVGVPDHKGYIKVGYTEQSVEERIKQQSHTVAVKTKTLYENSAMRNDGTCFMDYDVHNILERRGFKRLNSGKDRNEWFKCSVDDVINAVEELKTGQIFNGIRNRTFKLRPEQQQAINKTVAYYKSFKKENKNIAPKFLWNAKMRFGKTFTAYELAKEMGLKNILILTFKPAVESAWSEDLYTHTDFAGWQFISNKNAKYSKKELDDLYEKADKSKPIVCFGSFQDLLGTTDTGAIKPKNEFIHTTNWDLVIFDEYHFGAWRDNAKKLFAKTDEDKDYDFDTEKYKQTEADNAYNETFLHITTDYYLFLSGTPFRAISTGEFIEEQIYSWTYSDEQQAKENWDNRDGENPYLALPRMVLMTYKIPKEIREIAEQGEYDEFDLNVFFSAKFEKDKNGKEKAVFVYKDYVQKWLDLIRGSYMPASTDDLKLGKDKRPPMPFSDTRLLNVLSHTVWFLPDIASCFAMEDLLNERQNTFYRDYKINVCAGVKAGVGLDALPPVLDSMEEPLKSKTITLSCGKLMTGVTVKPWTAIFMLRNLQSPETYFQAAFRVQSPWEVPAVSENGNTKKEIVKKECYVFDFALDRALRQIADYSCKLNVKEINPEKKVSDFIKFLPVLAYDGAKMVQIDAQDILDITRSGTSATLLARRWESALLVNVDNDTLLRLKADDKLLEALKNIEGFRALNHDIEVIINRSEKVKKAKKEGTDDLPKEKKKELTEQEKEMKSLRKQIQENLIKFAARIPIFMYLTDYRENCLQDIIKKLEPELFKKVTGLNITDFDKLCSIGIFNSSLMNDAIYKFKRYEDDSLSYTGIDKHAGENVGGWDTTITHKEYEELFFNQQK